MTGLKGSLYYHMRWFRYRVMYFRGKHLCNFM